MLKKLLLTATLGVFVVAGIAGYARAFEEPIPTKISLLKWGGNPRVGKLYKIVSKGVFTLSTPGASDPIALGGALSVTVASDLLECDLEAGAWDGSRGWTGLGNPAGSKGYKYINMGAPGNDPCKIAIIKEKVIKVLAKGVGGISLPGPAGTNPEVTMDLVAGEDRYCAEATAPHFKEKEETLLKMKDQPAPVACPLPEIGAHKCVLAVDETTPGNASNVTVSLQSGPFPVLPVSGSLDIVCGAIDPGTGIATCECNIQELDPINFIGLGFVCFSPSSGCQMGQIDCDGGDALNVDLVSNHILGTCVDKPDCVARCTAFCSAGYVLSAACEGFCNGGSNDGVPCVADSDCPGGACPGTEPQTHASTCNCDCVTVDGAVTPPGTLQCDVATRVDVELAAPCDGLDTLISIGTQCIPVTSGTFTSIMRNANNTPGKDFPVGGLTSSGQALGSCEDLATSLTAGLELTGGANFYDTLIGDISVSTTFICQ